ATVRHKDPVLVAFTLPSDRTHGSPVGVDETQKLHEIRPGASMWVHQPRFYEKSLLVAKVAPKNPERVVKLRHQKFF
ncbi:MAG TPA: hypothetical protein PLZ74_09560, partial [Kiritimatiellia bacterium]|nr:hypothetical protein [Kiritimatiellia bacterium]HOR98608.1 hypothetical protein [Kiritimatiellia bacterium]